MEKVLRILRVISFIIMALTSVPLVVNYFLQQEIKYEFVVHLHVLFGALFLITAIPTMIMLNKASK